MGTGPEAGSYGSISLSAYALRGRQSPTVNACSETSVRNVELCYLKFVLASRLIGRDKRLDSTSKVFPGALAKRAKLYYYFFASET